MCSTTRRLVSDNATNPSDRKRSPNLTIFHLNSITYKRRWSICIKSTRTNTTIPTTSEWTSIRSNRITKWADSCTSYWATRSTTRTSISSSSLRGSFHRIISSRRWRLRCCRATTPTRRSQTRISVDESFMAIWLIRSAQEISYPRRRLTINHLATITRWMPAPVPTKWWRRATSIRVPIPLTMSSIRVRPMSLQKLSQVICRQLGRVWRRSNRQISVTSLIEKQKQSVTICRASQTLTVCISSLWVKRLTSSNECKKPKSWKASA